MDRCEADHGITGPVLHRCTDPADLLGSRDEGVPNKQKKNVVQND